MTVLKAGALYYALFLSFLIFVVLGVVISAGFYQQKGVSILFLNQRLYDNVESALNYSLQNRTEWFDGIPFDLFGDTRDTVSIVEKRWGGYKLYDVMSYDQNRTYSRVFLIGGTIRRQEEIVLIKRNTKDLLNLCGASVIKGGINFSSSYLIESSIEGVQSNSVAQANLIDYKLPCVSISDLFLKECRTYLNFNINDFQKDSIVTNYRSQYAIERSFKENTLVIFDKEDVDLRGRHFIGNIIIVSSGQVFVDSSTYLKDVIIYARSVVVEDRFRGSIQIYANDFIRVGIDCRFDYPSIAAVLNSSQTNDTKLYIGKGTTFLGTLILKNNELLLNNITDVGAIEINGHVKGLVWSDSFVEHHGRVDGTVICTDFIMNTESGIYKNFIFDAELHALKDKNDFLFPLIFADIEKQKVVDWLN